MKPTAHILMIRPVRFTFNEETAVNNAFQVAGTAVPGATAGPATAAAPGSVSTSIQQAAAAEFDAMVNLLTQNGVDVTVVNDTPEPFTPDSIFPNNWVSFHTDGTLILYPMFAANRRLERKEGVIEAISQKFEVSKRIDLSGWESKSQYLEGTGSMVLDRFERIAYACLSPRTDPEVLDDFCRRLLYRPMAFTAVDGGGTPIYHTNVMMCVGETYVVICTDAIPNANERKMVTDMIQEGGKTVVPITLDQMNHFAGNMLQVCNKDGERLLIMSSQAYRSLTRDQVGTLSAQNRILYSDLTTIESNGGGSARCMMAEVFLQPKKGSLHP